MNTVSRVVAILLDLGENPQGSKLTAMASRLAIPQSSLHRALTSLKKSGFIYQSADSKEYFLGPTIRRLSTHVYPDLWKEELTAACRSLWLETGESVAVAELYAGQLTYTDILHSANTLRPSIRVGQSLKLSESAAGAVISRSLFEGGNDSTFIRREVGEHFAITVEGDSMTSHGIPMWTLAVPVKSANGKVESAICIIAPEFRVAGAGEQRLIERVQATIRDYGALSVA